MLKTICFPALLYLIIAIIITPVLIFTKLATISESIINFLINLLWTWLLNYLCNKKYITLSWILFFIPLILSIISLIILRKLYSIEKDNNFY
jgi:hypothetical protein